MSDYRQLSFEDCFITRNGIRAQYGLTALYPSIGDVIIPPSEIATEKKMCRYWQYFNACCKNRIPPKSYEEWEKEHE